MRRFLHHVALWLARKTNPGVLTGGQWSGTSFTDAYRRNRNPTPNELLAELKGVAWSCASLNASVCAAYPPRLFVATAPDQPRPRCRTRALHPAVEQRLRERLWRSGTRQSSVGRIANPSYNGGGGSLATSATTKGARLEEVLDHPLLTLLAHGNPVHNAFDLWELTCLYQEVHGSAYWYLSLDPFLHVPTEIWILPSQNVTPRRAPDSRNLVDAYVYRTGAHEQSFRPDEIIHFRYPDPRDPYTAGLSPLRACFEQLSLASEFTAFKSAKFANHALPDAIISPESVIGEEERDRLEAQWNTTLRQGGSGRAVVAESGLKVQLLNHSMGDLAALADLKATKEEIANAFHVPLSFLTSETNLANLQAAEHQHMAKAIDPRLKRRDEKLNEQLVPLFDPTGRLFLASEDPVPVNREMSVKEREVDMKYGVVTINEVRGERGLLPVPWGDTPWLPGVRHEDITEGNPKS
jgi:HK97 family phage portal protein